MAEGSVENGVLLSVHPEWARAIASGIKQVEFRRRGPKRPISTAVIYSTAPVQAVVAICTITSIDTASPHAIWRRYGHLGLISPEKYNMYYRGRSLAVAIRFSRIVALPYPCSLRAIGWDRPPPQSFGYVNVRAVFDMFGGASAADGTR